MASGRLPWVAPAVVAAMACAPGVACGSRPVDTYRCTPLFTEFEVFPGKQANPYSVPTTPGTYELVCEIEGRLETGMSGTIVVQEATGAVPQPLSPAAGNAGIGGDAFGIPPLMVALALAAVAAWRPSRAGWRPTGVAASMHRDQRQSRRSAAAVSPPDPAVTAVVSR